MAIKGGRMPSPGSMPSFEEMKEVLGFNTYYEEEMRYRTETSQPRVGKGKGKRTYLAVGQLQLLFYTCTQFVYRFYSAQIENCFIIH